MIALVQRVVQARVEVAGRVTGAIGRGLLVFVCAEPDDDEALADKLVAKLIKLRIFPDDAGRMNRSVADVARAKARAAMAPRRKRASAGASPMAAPRSTMAAMLARSSGLAMGT